MSLPSMNFLHLTVSEIQPRQTISHRPPAHPDTMGENNTPTALKGWGVKTEMPYIRNVFKYICIYIKEKSNFVVDFMSNFSHLQRPGLLFLTRIHGGRVVTLSPPTSEAGVRFMALPQVRKLVVPCR